MAEANSRIRGGVARQNRVGKHGLETIIRKEVLIAWLLAVPVLAGGCETTAKTGLRVAKGVQAEVLPINDALTFTRIDDYNTLKLGKVDSDIGQLCPDEVLVEIRKSAPRIFAERTQESFRGGPKVLTANIVVRFYRKFDLLSGTGRLDLLATLVDSESGTDIGKVYVEGITESPVHTGIDDMVEETTKRLADYLKKTKG